MAMSVNMHLDYKKVMRLTTTPAAVGNSVCMRIETTNYDDGQVALFLKEEQLWAMKTHIEKYFNEKREALKEAAE